MEIGKGDPYWSRGWFMTHAFSPKLFEGFGDMPADLLHWTIDRGSKWLQWPWEFETPNDTSWRVIKKLIDDRREINEPDFQPGPNTYPVPESYPVNHEVNDKFKKYFESSVTLKFMKGEMKNFNYPESQETLFNMDRESTIDFEQTSEGYKVELIMETEYNADSFENKWTGESINMREVDKSEKITAFLPFDQLTINENINPNTDAIMFDFYDEKSNQVFFFDLFLVTDDSGAITSKHPYGVLTIFGRPHDWLNLDDVWKPQDLIAQNFVF